MKLFEVIQPLSVDFSAEKAFKSNVKVENNLKISNKKDSDKTIILNIINNFKRNVNGNVSIGLGGNCGKFALALSDALKLNNTLTTIGILFRNVNGIEIYNVKDLMAAETDIYHTIVIDGRGNFYDASGALSKNDLMKIAQKEYGDGNPGFLADISITDPTLKILINNDTNWSENESYFLRLFNKSKKKRY